MKQIAQDWIVNISLMSIGYFCRIVFGLDHFTPRQLLAFFLACIGGVWVVDKIDISEPVKLTIMLSIGLVMPNLIRILVKTGNKSERKISDKISDEIADRADDIIDKADKINKIL